jgi:hypothetical protein
MGNTNYFSGIVKILEKPKQYNINERTPLTQFRVEISQKRKSSIASLLIWGNLGRDVKNFYTVNDYILIEGYTSIRSKSSQILVPTIPSNNLKQVFITVLRIYPVLLNKDRTNANN